MILRFPLLDIYAKPMYDKSNVIAQPCPEEGRI